MGETKRSGGCLCGAIRYEARKAPKFSVLCHCHRIDTDDPADQNALFESLLRHASP